MSCTICGGKVEGEEYGDSQCLACGQEYEYEEGPQLVLSDEQIALLKAQKDQSK